MIKIYAYLSGIKEITDLCKSISISGDVEQVARKLELTLAYSIFDKNQTKINIPVGTKIWVILDGKEIFRGIVWDRDVNSSSQELSITAYDYLIYLTKSKVTYNFKNISADEATRKICSELGIQVGNLATTGRYSRVLAQTPAYDAIMEMYTQDSKMTGNKYIAVMTGDNLNVIKKGTVIAGFSLISQADNSNNNISNLDYKNSLDSMINRVKIYDDKNNYVGEVSNTEWIKSFGVLQDNYVKEQDKNANTVATNMLKGITEDLTIEALGNWDCRTGYAVKVQISYLDTLQNKIIYIDGDTHTWEVATGKHTMSLTLNFINKMDEKGD